MLLLLVSVALPRPAAADSPCQLVSLVARLYVANITYVSEDPAADPVGASYTLRTLAPGLNAAELGEKIATTWSNVDAGVIERLVDQSIVIAAKLRINDMPWVVRHLSAAPQQVVLTEAYDALRQLGCDEATNDLPPLPVGSPAYDFRPKEQTAKGLLDDVPMMFWALAGLFGGLAAWLISSIVMRIVTQNARRRRRYRLALVTSIIASDDPETEHPVTVMDINCYGVKVRPSWDVPPTEHAKLTLLLDGAWVPLSVVWSNDHYFGATFDTRITIFTVLKCIETAKYQKKPSLMYSR